MAPTRSATPFRIPRLTGTGGTTPPRPPSPQSPITDLSAYPVLTEEVGFPPSPIASQPGTTSVVGSGAGSLGQIAAKAVADVLGWKVKPGDAKGFVGALTQSFTLTEVEGHIESTWTPRSYAVQTDLSGGITGAQASIYSRAKEALEKALPLLDGLYALDPEAVAEDVAALKAVAKSQFTELVNEMGFLGGPRIQRVNQYFNLLLGDSSYPLTATHPAPGDALTITDPDRVGGTLGNLRDELGLSFVHQDFVNSVEDEVDLSNFRIVSDYVTSLAQSWINNLSFVGLDTKTPFFGTQLILLSRQLMVVAESVDEVRFTLDSVFIGPAERQTIQLDFGGTGSGESPMFLEDLLSWARTFATDEGPRLVQDGGKFGVQNTFLPVASKLLKLVSSAQSSTGPLPPGFSTPRVTLSLGDLADQLQDLVNLATPIDHTITPQPDFGLPFEVTGVEPRSIIVNSFVTGGGTQIFIRGSGFQSNASVTLVDTAGLTPAATFQTFFRSENLLVLGGPAGTSATGANLLPVIGKTLAGFVGKVVKVMVNNPDGMQATSSNGVVRFQ